ncbi:zinc finger protein 816-like [Belonocnema kinseyi]|uniref:zinc finger protein 816-like n=1 Tax=Belonocnema kinseyi TaxID=2817044 RepID=UPI00143E0297|nr:zinc finger protein 816-like [Belonocnema kinseyi]
MCFEEETAGDRLNKKYDSKCCAVDIKEDNTFATKSKVRSQKKQKIQKSGREPVKKYECDKCARTYKHEKSLTQHLKYECDVTPRFKYLEGMSEPREPTGIWDGGQHFYTTNYTSCKNYSAQTLIFYDDDETLEIKEEIIENQNTTSKKRNKKYESKLCVVDLRKDNILSTEKKLCSKKKQKVHESKCKPGKTYKCKKCARSYKQKHTLKSHQKYECNVMPQYNCQFCGKLFKRVFSRNRHVRVVHLNTNLEASPTRHNCDKCSRSYTWRGDLNRHQRLVHAAVAPQFNCDICDYKTKLKGCLATHIVSKHIDN